MIARNLKAGSYAAGLIEYTFSGKEEGRRAEEKKADLYFASGDLFLPKSYDDKEGIARLHKSFNERTHEYLKQNPDNKSKLIGHQVLSFTEKDMQRLKPEGVQRVLQEYLELSKIDQTQFYSVGHNDTKNYHIHIVYHKVGEDGKQIDQWKENVKTTERGIALSLKYKLDLVDEMHKYTHTKGVLAIRGQHQDIIDLTKSSVELSQAKNMHHFKKLMLAQGKLLEPINKGESFKFEGKRVSADDLAAVFYHNRNKERGETSKNRSIDEGFTRVSHERRGGKALFSSGDDNEASVSKSRLPAPPKKYGSSFIPKAVKEEKRVPFRTKKRMGQKKKQKSNNLNI